MKNNLKLLSLIFAASALASCSTAQKSAKIEIAPMPVKVSHGGESAMNQYKLGRHFQNTQQLDEAFLAYQKTLALDPTNAQAATAMAVLHAERGNYQTSIAQLRQLLEKAPNNASLYNNLGYVYYLNGNYEEAVIVLDKAIALDHTNIHALNNMGATFNKLGHTERALNYIALAKSIKTGKIRTAKDDVSEIASDTALVASPDTFQQPVTNLAVVETPPATEIKQLSSGIYEVTQLVNKPQPAQSDSAGIVVAQQQVAPVNELKIAESGGVSYKVHPLISKVFDESALASVSNPELSNKSYLLEIVNGNGVRGFARKVSEALSEMGLTQPQQLA
ncbi:MAG: tetratricopeptide repeat protein, partial [Methylophilaceae bacterium]